MKHSRFTKAQINWTRGRPNNMGQLAPIFDLDQHEYQSFVTTWLRKEVANDRSPVKALAEAAGSSVAAAKHWHGGDATPQGIYMSRLRARFPRFDAEMRRLEGMQSEMSPEFGRALNEMLMHYIRSDAGGPIAQALMEHFGRKAEIVG